MWNLYISFLNSINPLSSVRQEYLGISIQNHSKYVHSLYWSYNFTVCFLPLPIHLNLLQFISMHWMEKNNILGFRLTLESANL